MAVGGVQGELVSWGGSLLSRENTGKFSEILGPGGTGVEFPERFRGGSDGFPVIVNRESIPTNKEVSGIRSGLWVEILKPIRPLSPSADSKQTGQESLADELSQILPRFLEAAREEDQGDGESRHHLCDLFPFRSKLWA